MDPAAWPETVPMSADHSDWSYCFNGVQLFTDMSMPEHRVLRNRKLGKYLTFIINPRENFDHLIRERIRARVAAYTNGVVPPDLGFYGNAENREWTQYQLEEADVPRPAKCPFHGSPGLTVPHVVTFSPSGEIDRDDEPANSFSPSNQEN